MVIFRALIKLAWIDQVLQLWVHYIQSLAVCLGACWGFPCLGAVSGGSVTLSTYCCLAIANWILCWIVVLPIASSDLAEMVLYAILIANCRLNWRLWELCKLNSHHWLKSNAHWLWVKPKLKLWRNEMRATWRKNLRNYSVQSVWDQ